MLGFPGGSDGKESACHAGDPGSIPGSGRSPGEGNGNSLQYSRLENPTAEEPGGLPSLGQVISENRVIKRQVYLKFVKIIILKRAC